MISKKVKKKFKEHQAKTIHICATCNKELIGINEVKKHIIDKRHFEYKLPETNNGSVMFA